MSDKEPVSIVPVSVASQIAELAVTNPEAVYDKLAKAEKWIKEIKESARQVIISRMTEAPKLEIETNTYTIQALRNRPQLKADKIRAVLAAKGINSDTVVYKTTVYEALPNARDTLDTMLKSKLITQGEYDLMFEAPKVTVSVKQKSAKNIISLDADGE